VAPEAVWHGEALERDLRMAVWAPSAVISGVGQRTAAGVSGRNKVAWFEDRNRVAWVEDRNRVAGV